jgi:glutamine synthetase adenylyltransferase
LKLETLDAGLPRGTVESLDALALRGALTRADADALKEGHSFFRAVEQTLRLLDEHNEPILRPRSRTGEHVARRLGLRARDGQKATEVLESTYRRHAMRIRGIFERVIGPVDVSSPFGDEG